MRAIIRTWSVLLVTLSVGLATMWAGCNITVQTTADSEDDPQVAGSTPDDTNDGTAQAGDSTTPNDDAGNPNSPCSNQTNIYVTYKNEWSARVSFVENFRDEEYGALAGSIFVLDPAGDAGDTENKCIACPNQAGVRNVKYSRDGVWTPTPYPADLFHGTFQCGDHITFTFQSNGSVTTQVQTP